MSQVLIYQLIYIFRLLVACICGIAIGFERKERSKEAGIRTHCVVACAAALMMIISKYGFTDLGLFDGVRAGGADPSRIASQVVSGVGFLGAGMIFVQKNTIKGLTTAAGVWATAGIGMAIGAGMYIVGITSTVIILLAQIILHLNNHLFQMPKVKVLKVMDVDSKTFKNDTIEKLKEMGISVSDVSITKLQGKHSKDYKFVLEVPINANEDAIMDMFDYECSLKGGN